MSHFSSTELGPGCRLEWHLDRWPEISGVFENIAPRHAQIIRVGTIVFDVPKLDRVRGRINFRLLDATGAEVTSNHHEIYLFPRTTNRSTSVISARRLREQLEHGL